MLCHCRLVCFVLFSFPASVIIIQMFGSCEGALVCSGLVKCPVQMSHEPEQKVQGWADRQLSPGLQGFDFGQTFVLQSASIVADATQRPPPPRQPCPSAVLSNGALRRGFCTCSASAEEQDQDDIEQGFVGIRIRDKDVSQGSFIFDVH